MVQGVSFLVDVIILIRFNLDSKSSCILIVVGDLDVSEVLVYVIG